MLRLTLAVGAEYELMLRLLYAGAEFPRLGVYDGAAERVGAE